MPKVFAESVQSLHVTFRELIEFKALPTSAFVQLHEKREELDAKLLNISMQYDNIAKYEETMKAAQADIEASKSTMNLNEGYVTTRTTTSMVKKNTGNVHSTLW